jgi:hypothetical protein
MAVSALFIVIANEVPVLKTKMAATKGFPVAVATTKQIDHHLELSLRSDVLVLLKDTAHGHFAEEKGSWQL